MNYDYGIMSDDGIGTRFAPPARAKKNGRAGCPCASARSLTCPRSPGICRSSRPRCSRPRSRRWHRGQSSRSIHLGRRPTALRSWPRRLPWQIVHDSLVGELGERVEAGRLRGGELSLADERLDLVGDGLAPAHVVGGLDDRGDVLPARTSAERRAADDGRYSDCRDCRRGDCPAHGAGRVDLSVH